MKAEKRCTRPRCICANEKLKLIGAIDGLFPDFGHHLHNEMGGLWLYPVKLLDGFWMHFEATNLPKEGSWLKADNFESYPHKNVFRYDYNLGMYNRGIVIHRTDLAPEGIKGILIKYTFENRRREVVECATRFVAHTDLTPCWLSDRAGLVDGQDAGEYLPAEGCFLAKDEENPWYTAISCTPAGMNHECGDFFGPEYTTGKGVSFAVEHSFTLKPYEIKEIAFHMAGSITSREEVLKQLSLLKADKNYEAEKKEKYDRIVQQSKLLVGDERFEEIYDWIKVHTNWLIMEQEKLGRGLTAGVPVYSWWFGCDNCYSLQGVLAMGDFELARDTLKLLHDYSKKHNANGRIVHEILPNGVCPNSGNTQETAHFISMVWKYYEWTGDWSLVEECFPYLEKSVAWLKEQDEDNDYFPSGYAMVEITGLDLEMLDSAVYACEAYDCFGRMLIKFGRTQEAEDYFALSEATRKAINDRLWDDRVGLYCDACASYNKIQTRKDMLERLAADGVSAETSEYILTLLKEREGDGDQERGWLLNRNWILATPMEAGIADKDKAERALARMRKDDFIGRYGLYLDSLTQKDTMTISTGVMAIAQATYGHPDEALRLLKKTFDTFSMATPGSVSEISPDYGCFVQAWTVYGPMVTVVKLFFGIDPRASEGIIILNPCIPESWPTGELTNVRVLDGTLDIKYERIADEVQMTVCNRTSYSVKIAESCKEKNKLILIEG